MSTYYQPEMDGSPELGSENHKYYQELIGIMRWATELGRVDIVLEISLFSQYQACWREGHMEQAMRILGYLQANPKFSLYLDPRPTNLNHDQVRSNSSEFRAIYCHAKEIKPPRMPKPRGHEVDISAFVDASHAANRRIRGSRTGYVIFVQSTPIIWFSKQ